MRRYLATGGEYGEVPDFYLTIRAAEKLGMSAPDLDTMPDGEYWESRALAAIRAEVGAQKTRDQANAPRAARRRPI